jgi:hypothetical protein
MLACYQTAQSAFPGVGAHDSGHPAFLMKGNIKTCMVAVGYQWTMFRDECPVVDGEVVPDCYIDGSLYDRLEEWWHGVKVHYKSTGSLSCSLYWDGWPDWCLERWQEHMRGNAVAAPAKDICIPEQMMTVPHGMLNDEDMGLCIRPH